MQSPNWQCLVATLFIGVGATALTDLWTLLRARVLHISALDYALLGRWLLHMRHGQWVHERIAAAPTHAGERPLGWLLHYLIGVAFALVLLAWQGQSWLEAPRLQPALLWGLTTAVFPLFVMQPCWGAGIAASRTPAPWKTRFHSLLLHAIFGGSLYLCAQAWRWLATNA